MDFREIRFVINAFGSIALFILLMGEFVRPKPKVKLSSNILDEDEYLAKLEAIIKRDFFPELKQLEELRNG